jgi:hypothetical protein
LLLSVGARVGAIKKPPVGGWTSTWDGHVLYVMIAMGAAASWAARCVAIAGHSTGNTVIRQRNPTRLVTHLGTSLCMNSGRREDFWGLKKKFGDNPGDSKIPLDLGLFVREGIRRTGERTPTGTG